MAILLDPSGFLTITTGDDQALIEGSILSWEAGDGQSGLTSVIMGGFDTPTWSY